MKRKQRIIGGLMSLCMAVSVLPISAQAARLDRFQDIPRDAWYYDAVDHMVAQDYFEGVSDNEFAPNAKMTRAMFVTVLSRYDGSERKSGQSAYTDVPAGAWYTGAVNWAAYNKLVEGKGGGKFDPDGYVTREEICTILNRYFLFKEMSFEKQNVSVSFTDADKINTWASGSVKKCVQYGIVTGYPDGSFLPQATATRAEVASILYRLAILAEGGTLNGVATGGSASGGSGGGSGGGTGGETGGTVISDGDLVGQGLEKAVALASACLNDDDAAVQTSLDYEQYTDKGAIIVESEAELTQNFSAVLVEEAVAVISVAKAATTGEELTEAQIKTTIDYITDELGVAVSSSWKNALAQNLAAKTAGLGENMRAALRNYEDNTQYPFTAISVEGGDGTVLYTVDMSTGRASLTDEQIISALAKELGAQMKDSLRSKTSPVDDLDLKAGLELNFTIVDVKALADCTDTVEIAISVFLEGSGDLQYCYDAEKEVDCLITEITPVQQDEYDVKINELLQAALDKVLENADTEIPAGMDVEALLTGENVRALINGDYDELYDEIDTIVGDVLTEKQINDALANSDNALINQYELADIVEIFKANGVEKLKNTVRTKMISTASEQIIAKVNNADCSDELKEAVTDDIAAYIAYTAINGVIHDNYPDVTYLDSYTEDAKDDVIESGELDALIEALKAEDAVADAIETAEPFEKLMTFDSMCEMTMKEFAAVLTNKNVADAIDEQDDSILTDITASLTAVPDGASVTIDGKTISSTQISNVKKASTPKAARLAVADVMDTLGDLTLADFDDGEDVTVKYTGGAYTMNMTIYT